MTSQNQTTPITAATISIPFSKLTHDPANVRKRRSEESIKALADNIAADGLLQNLVVRETKSGKFAVVAGERRRRALALLVKRKVMQPSDEVPCRLISDGVTSASLAENTQREAMHPADQFEAWRKMADAGLTVEEIATRHGATTALIDRRLKLGRLSPVILAALRADEIDLDRAAAFALSDDHERQEGVFEALSKGHGFSAHNIKRMLTEGETPGSDKLARFVGREAYEAAGGEVRADLFGDTVYFKDNALLTRLGTEALEDASEKLRSEGWLWIGTAFDPSYSAGQRMRRIYPQTKALSKADQKEKTRLQNRLVKIEDAADSGEEAAIAEWQEIEEKLEALDAKASFYKPKEQAIAGGFVAIAHDGQLSVDLGFVRPEDDPKIAAAKKKAAKEKAEQPTGYGKSLRDDMAAIRLEILRAELLKNPLVARDLLVFHMVRSVREIGHVETPFDLAASQPYGARSVSEKGDMGRFEGREEIEALTAALPLEWAALEDEVESFEAFRALDDDAKVRLQAYAAAAMLKPQLSDEAEGEATLERAAAIMGSDPASYWTPGAAFFERMTKAHMLEVSGVVIGPDYAERQAKAKKGELAGSLGQAFLPPEDMSDAYPKARAEIAAWVPACMKTRDNGEADDGTSSPSEA